jgi:hypothetical protein
LSMAVSTVLAVMLWYRFGTRWWSCGIFTILGLCLAVTDLIILSFVSLLFGERWHRLFRVAICHRANLLIGIFFSSWLIILWVWVLFLFVVLLGSCFPWTTLLIGLVIFLTSVVPRWTIFYLVLETTSFRSTAWILRLSIFVRGNCLVLSLIPHSDWFVMCRWD